MAEAQDRGRKYENEKAEQPVDRTQAPGEVGVQEKPGKEAEKAVDEFRHPVPPPQYPRSVEHFQQHGIVGIRCERHVENPPRAGIKTGDRQVVGKLVARGRREQAKRRFDQQDREAERPNQETQAALLRHDREERIKEEQERRDHGRRRAEV